MIEEYKLPNGVDTVLTGTREENRIFKSICEARWQFTQDYCERKGWSKDPNDLTVKQILEINSQDGWKFPSVEGVNFNA